MSQNPVSKILYNLVIQSSICSVINESVVLWVCKQHYFKPIADFSDKEGTGCALLDLRAYRE